MCKTERSPPPDKVFSKFSSSSNMRSLTSPQQQAATAICTFLRGVINPGARFNDVTAHKGNRIVEMCQYPNTSLFFFLSNFFFLNVRVEYLFCLVYVLL